MFRLNLSNKCYQNGDEKRPKMEVYIHELGRFVIVSDCVKRRCLH